MDTDLHYIKTKLYDTSNVNFSDYHEELESKAYKACRFKLNTANIVCRKAKVTPKKVGQFVTFWKRIDNGAIAPFETTDAIDFFVVNVRVENHFGQFVFPKETLIQKGIISSEKKEGKRAFRVYPPWDVPTNKQAVRTQEWQLNYFYEIGDTIDADNVKNLCNMLI